MYLKEEMLHMLKVASRPFERLNVCVSNRPVPVHPPFRPPAGIWGEEPRRLHDGDATGAEDEEGLDAHGTKAVGTLWSR